MATQYTYLQLKIIFMIQTIFFNKFYLLYVSEKVESAFEKINGLLRTNYESLRIKVIVNTLNHNFNFMVLWFFQNNIQHFDSEISLINDGGV